MNQNAMSMAKTPIHPAVVMLLFWGFILLVYIIGPVTLTPALSFTGLLFILTHISLFITGSVMSLLLNLPTSTIISRPHDQKQNQCILALLIIGIIGTLCSLYHQFSQVHSFNLNALAILRSMKAQSLLHGGEVHSSLLSIIAFLIYPAGFVGMIAGVLSYERLSTLTRCCIYLFIVALFCMTIMAGGRSPILLLILFLSISCYTRSTRQLPWMPRSRLLKLAGMILLMAFITYSSILWIVRAHESERNSAQMLQHASTVWGAEPKPYLLSLSNRINKPSLTMAVLGPVFYFTQNISVTEKIINHDTDIPVLFGSYHIDLLAAVLRLFPDSASLLKEHYETLLTQDIYGYFTGAWGALFIDYGYMSLFAALIWGMFAGVSWVMIKRYDNIYAATFYILWLYSIMISFASPPLGFSNSFMIFVWFFVFFMWNKPVNLKRFLSTNGTVR
jgi:oligosaccharide repeat unit polymerase